MWWCHDDIIRINQEFKKLGLEFYGCEAASDGLVRVMFDIKQGGN